MSEELEGSWNTLNLTLLAHIDIDEDKREFEIEEEAVTVDDTTQTMDGITYALAGLQGKATNTTTLTGQ